MDGGRWNKNTPFNLTIHLLICCQKNLQCAGPALSHLYTHKPFFLGKHTTLTDSVLEKKIHESFVC